MYDIKSKQQKHQQRQNFTQIRHNAIGFRLWCTNTFIIIFSCAIVCSGSLVFVCFNNDERNERGFSRIFFFASAVFHTLLIEVTFECIGSEFEPNDWNGFFLAREKLLVKNKNNNNQLIWIDTYLCVYVCAAVSFHLIFYVWIVWM